MFAGKRIFRDSKITEELPNIKPLEEEMLRLERNLDVFDTPLYQGEEHGIDSTQVFSQCSRDSGFCVCFA